MGAQIETCHNCNLTVLQQCTLENRRGWYDDEATEAMDM